LHKSKKPFGKAHELGHNSIPEHKAILYVCSEHDLNPQTRDEMEYEANIFASETIYPSQLMDPIYKNYPLSMETILLLAELSQGSIHSAALRYVSGSDKECCLLIFDVFNGNEIDPKGLKLKSQLFSTPWIKKYKKKIIKDDQFLPPEHKISNIVFSNDSPDQVVKDEITVKDIGSFNAHVFYNSFNVFTLLFKE
jgi:hypothetical protein